MSNNYSAKNIKHLDAIEGIQTRPGMYVGGIGLQGTFHLYKEAIDNSIDEFYVDGSDCDTITVKYDSTKDMITVSDNGRGIPVVKNVDMKKIKVGDVIENEDDNVLEVIVTNIHAGGKFDKDAYKTSSGLHGVGLTAVNALSDYMKVISHRDGFIWEQEYSKGIATSYLTVTGKSNKTGTLIEFIPSKDILKDIELNDDLFIEDVKARAYLNKGLKVIYSSDKTKKTEFYFKDGIKDLLKEVNNKPLIPSKDILYIESDYEEESVYIEVALSYSKSNIETCLSYANSINTKEHGTHVTGLRMSLTNTILSYIEENKMVPKKDKDLKITGDDVRDGLVAIISVRVGEIIFQGQTKDKLMNREVQGLVQKSVNDALNLWFDENKEIAKTISNKVILNAKGRRAASSARLRVQKDDGTFLSSMSSISKLSSCTSKDPSEKELYIVEGDSAGGSAKDGRDKKTQAIYALRGKVLNTNDTRISKVLSNKEISDLISAIGSGIQDNCDPNKSKYHKIVITTDADVDGLHIQSLLMTLFLKYMRPLIDAGYLYIAVPPLYSITERGKTIYLSNDDEYNKFILNRVYKEDIYYADSEGNLNVLENKEVKNLYAKSLDYKNELSRLISKTDINVQILEIFMTYLDLSDYENWDHDDYVNAVTTLNEVIQNTSRFESETISVSYDGNSFIINGFIDNVYENIYISDNLIMEDLRFLREKLITAVASISEDYQAWTDLYHESNDEYLNYGLGSLLLYLDKKHTPKSRSRLKGLGEMDADQLYNTTLDPKNRTLIQVKINDDEEVETVNDILMGTNAELRRDFIEDHINNTDLYLDI